VRFIQKSFPRAPQLDRHLSPIDGLGFRWIRCIGQTPRAYALGFSRKCVGAATVLNLTLFADERYETHDAEGFFLVIVGTRARQTK
jgi:hypothetical protein